MTADSLSPAQQALLAYLLANPGKSLKQAAEALGIAYRTARRWAALPAFKAAQVAASEQLVEDVFARWRRLGDLAAETLERNLDAARASDQIKAAMAILFERRKRIEEEEWEQRIKALEGDKGNEQPEEEEWA
jgi:hypothetical protein